MLWSHQNVSICLLAYKAVSIHEQITVWERGKLKPNRHKSMNELSYEYFWWAEIFNDGKEVISFNHYLKRGLRSVNGVSSVKYKFHSVFGTCSEEKEKKMCCPLSLYFFLTFSLRFSHLLAHLSLCFCLALCLTSFLHSFPPLPFLIFPDFAYSPSTCQPSKFLCNCQNCVRKHFRYLYISPCCFSAASSLNGKCCWME